MIEIREYVDNRGRSPFGRWFDGLDAGAAVRVRKSLARMEAGWQPVQRQRRWQRGVGVPHKRWSRLQSLFRQRWEHIDNPTRLWHKSPPIEGARELWQEYRRRKQQEV